MTLAPKTQKTLDEILKEKPRVYSIEEEKTEVLKRTITPSKQPSLVFPDNLWYDLMYVVRAVSPKEVTLYGTLVVVPEVGFVVEELIIPKQTGAATSTETQGAMTEEYIREKFKDDPLGALEFYSKMKLWIHSHPGMATNWSMTDTTTMITDYSDWFVALVVNEKEDYRVRLNYCTPYVPFHMYKDDLPLKVTRTDSCRAKELDELIEQNVKSSPNRIVRSYSSLVSDEDDDDDLKSPYPHRISLM
jgi:proteasome lid subunit RPN8/RPN11